MKISENWLREWVNPTLSREALSERLTMSGLEVEDVQPVADTFTGVLVGHVLAVEKHPQADRLQVCQVDVGDASPLTIVCGAANVRAGMKAAAAVDGAILAGNFKIKKTKLRGVASEGMLCSAKELGLAETSDGLYELPADAPVGQPVWDYLLLSDYIFDISITPNRGDCLGMLGMATEVAALTEAHITLPDIKPVTPVIDDFLPVNVDLPTDCPRYVGRVIRGVQSDKTSPIWLQERLRRAGTRSINIIVDVMNYVMYELGQPMHAFDLAKITKEIRVRGAQAGEQIDLLDGSKAKLKPETLIIADQHQPLAIAGVMGGVDSGVTRETQDIFLESAFFMPESIMRSVRCYGLGSESSYRFERGVDPTLALKAIERATALILTLAGGQPGPVIHVEQASELPTDKSIHLRSRSLQNILGLSIDNTSVENILKRLGFSCQSMSEGWNVTVPARRFDVIGEVDLVEEIARIYGYDEIPLHLSKASFQLTPMPETVLSTATIRQALCRLGYSEVISYSFVEEKILSLFDPSHSFKKLTNPISSEMEVMRSTLWPSLVTTLLYNQNRQQSRARLFEIGLRFIMQDDVLLQQPVLSGLIAGDVLPEQWGISARSVDFFDVKGDLETVFQLTHASDQFLFKPCEHPALHPGQSAEIIRGGQHVGFLGLLSPNLTQSLKVEGKVYLFELLLAPLLQGDLPHYTELSKFPEIRRDLAFLVDRTVPVRAIQDTISSVGGELLQDVDVFDVYEGKGIAASQKSVALRLILQHSCRTLVDDEVAELMQRIISTLKEKFAAELRG